MLGRNRKQKRWSTVTGGGGRTRPTGLKTRPIDHIYVSGLRELLKFFPMLNIFPGRNMYTVLYFKYLKSHKAHYLRVKTVTVPNERDQLHNIQR